MAGAERSTRSAGRSNPGWMMVGGSAAPPRLLVVVALVSTGACSKMAEIDVEYHDCVEPTIPYRENFREDFQGLLDRCWETSGAAGNEADVAVDDGDLLIMPLQAIQWTDAQQGPAVYRVLEGDFVAATRVETASGASADHCLDPADAAGLFVRPHGDGQGGAGAGIDWATFLIRPDVTEPPRCVEDSDNPPNATATARSHGPTTSPEVSVSPIGDDGEADIALCRFGDFLYYYYRPVWSNPGAWRVLQGVDGQKVDEIDGELADVGMTAVSSGGPTQATGNFGWIVIQAEGELGGDGCERHLSALALPEED